MMTAELKNYTTFRIGGPCRSLTECTDARSLTEAFRSLRAVGVPVLVIGQGSNLLVSDVGTEAAVLRFFNDGAEPVFETDTVTVPGGMPLDPLAQAAMDRGQEGLTFCCGIPGTVGGAVAGNAGAFGEQIGDRVMQVEVLEPDGSVSIRSPKELGFSYRHSSLREEGGIVLSVRLRLESGDRGALQARRNEIMQFRREHHPDWRKTPCAGSFFRNIEPSSAAERRKAAGWFLEQAGAHAMRVGGARVFEKHANIIIAEPEASAQEVYQLSERMRAAVQEQFGIQLVREVQLIGPF